MIDERSMISLEASLLAIKTVPSYEGSPASWLLKRRTQRGHKP